jgi:hypothetical protein
MEMCYDDSACVGSTKYPDTTAGANTLAKIDPDGTPLYLSVPKDPKDVSPYQYTWTDGTDQYYCVYTKLEAQSNSWFCASNKGTAATTSDATYTPSNTDCCGLDVTK